MADLARHYRITRTIGAAMIASLLVYAVVVETIRARFAPFGAGSAVDFYFFLVLSLLLFGIHFPRWDQWREWARRIAR